MGKKRLSEFLAIRGMGQVISVTIAMLVMVLVFGLINPTFFSGENTTNRAFLFVNLRLRLPYFRMRGQEMSMKSVFAFSFGGKYTIIKMICTAPISAR